MWTYHTPATVPGTPQPAGQSQRPALPPKPVSPPRPAPAPTPARPKPLARTAAVGRRKAGNRLACGMGALYLLGLCIGAACSRFLSSTLLTYAEYYTQFSLNLHKTGNQPLIFSTGFLSLFVQLTLLLVLGFCVLGCGLIPAFLLVKGTGTGCFFALLYTQLGPVKGLFMQALIFWLPEVLGSLVVVLLSVYALRVSFGLFSSCTGHIPPSLRQNSKRLVNRYLILCFIGMMPCICSVTLSLWFSGLF